MPRLPSRHIFLNIILRRHSRAKQYARRAVSRQAERFFRALPPLLAHCKTTSERNGFISAKTHFPVCHVVSRAGKRLFRMRRKLRRPRFRIKKRPPFVSHGGRKQKTLFSCFPTTFSRSLSAWRQFFLPHKGNFRRRSCRERNLPPGFGTAWSHIPRGLPKRRW